MFGISQNPNTKNDVIVLQNKFCKKCDEIYTDIKYKWCKPCQIKNLKENFTNLYSGNEKIDNLVQEMQLNINDVNNIVFEWIPYNQLNYLEKIDGDEFFTFSAIWKDGPLYWNNSNKKYIRKSYTKVTLYITELLNEV
jgi:hypothetical protein